MLSRRLFLKGAASVGAVVATAAMLPRQVLAKVYTARVHGRIVECGAITERCNWPSWDGTATRSSYKYSVDHVRYYFPEGEIKRVWLDGQEVSFNQQGQSVRFYHLALDPFGNRVPVATAEIVA